MEEHAQPSASFPSPLFPERRARPAGPRTKHCARAAEPLERRVLLSAATFVPSGHYEFTSTPRDTVVADFNGDGAPDTASVLPLDTTVGVLLNQGDGTFRRAPGLPTEFARAVTAADFNGDGRVDLAVLGAENSNKRGGSVEVFLGNGNGTFARPPAKYHLFAAGPAVVATDLNGDGFADLVVATGKRVAVLMNEQDGAFAKPVYYAIGGEHPTALAVGDFNNDAVPDLAVTRGRKSSVTILLGNAATPGTFGLPGFVPTAGKNPSAVTTGDFNHDGFLDLAVTNSEFRGNALAVIIGNGDGTFRPPALYGGANFADAVLAGDFSGTGNADLVVGSFDSPLKLFAGYGDGTFAPPVVVPDAEFTQYIRSADFNGDGLPDLAVTPYTGVRFDFNATPTPNPPATLGPPTDKTLGAGNGKSFTFYTPEGTVAAVSLAGPGSATLHFSSSQPIGVPQGRNTLNVTALTLADVTATNTTAASTLSISARGGSGTINLPSVSSDSAIGAIDAPRANLTGDLTLPGGAGRVSLLSASNGTVALGAGGRTSLAFQSLAHETITAAGPVAKLAVRLDASVTLTAPSVDTFAVGGTLLGSAISLTAPLAAGAFDLGRLTAAGGIAGTTIDSAGNVNAIVARDLLNSVVTAGVAPLAAGQLLPATAADFVAAASIGSVALATDPRRVSFSSSAIAASHVGSLNLGLVRMNNGGTAQGVAAGSIARVAGADVATRRRFRLNAVTSSATAAASLAAQQINAQDFTIRIL